MRRLLVAALVVPAMAACSGDEPPGLDGPEPEIEDVDRPGLRTSHVSLPLDDYYPTPDENLTLQKAQRLLINDCLRELGYSGALLPMPEPSNAEDLRPTFPPGVSSIAHARKHGYGSTGNTREDSNGGSSPDRAEPETRRKLRTGEVRKFHGNAVPEGGWQAESARTLTAGAKPPREVQPGGDGPAAEAVSGTTPGPLSNTEMYLDATRSQIRSRVQEHSQVRDMVDSWSQCMKERGFDYESPEEPAGADFGSEEGGSPTRRETRTAVADMKCKKKVNYVGVMVAVRSAYENRVLEARPEEFDQLRSNLDT